MVLGGHATSLIFSAVRKYFTIKHPHRNQPDPLNIHVQFLRLLAPDDLRLVITELRLGTRCSVVNVDVLTPTRKPYSDASRTWEGSFIKCITAIVMQGNLSTEVGVTLPSAPAIPPSKIPDRKRECLEVKIDKVIKILSPVTGTAVMWAVPDANGNGWGMSEGGAGKKMVQGHWITFADGVDEEKGFDVLSLGLLSDLVSLV
jgi:hypothetical protein